MENHVFADEKQKSTHILVSFHLHVIEYLSILLDATTNLRETHRHYSISVPRKFQTMREELFFQRMCITKLRFGLGKINFYERSNDKSSILKELREKEKL